MDTIDYCEGCCSISCILSNDFNDNGECPCTKCAIKVMCHNACNPFYFFRENILTQDKY